MGLFSLISNAAKAAVEVVGSGPTAIVKSVGRLAGTISEAIPGVGPFVGHVIPAAGAIFGTSEQRPTGDVSDQETSELSQTRKATRNTTEDVLGDTKKNSHGTIDIPAH